MRRELKFNQYRHLWHSPLTKKIQVHSCCLWCLFCNKFFSNCFFRNGQRKKLLNNWLTQLSCLWHKRMQVVILDYFIFLWGRSLHLLNTMVTSDNKALTWRPSPAAHWWWAAVGGLEDLGSLPMFSIWEEVCTEWKHLLKATSSKAALRSWHLL